MVVLFRVCVWFSAFNKIEMKLGIHFLFWEISGSEIAKRGRTSNSSLSKSALIGEGLIAEHMSC